MSSGTSNANDEPRERTWEVIRDAHRIATKHLSPEDLAAYLADDVGDAAVTIAVCTRIGAIIDLLGYDGSWFDLQEVGDHREEARARDLS